MDQLTKSRRERLVPHLRPNMVGLEIGAFTRPTLTSADADMRYVDYYSTEELEAQLGPDNPATKDIVHVDYVVKLGKYSDFIKEKFDVIIANHVMEHVCNPIDWLNDLESLLNEGGLIFLTLPDKKYSFDKYRPDTDVSRILISYFEDEKQPGRDRALEAMLYYDLSYIKRPMTLNQLNADRLRNELKNIHPGLHLFVFQGETFLTKIVKPIIFMKLCQMHIVDYVMKSNFGEFYTILGKGWAAPEFEFEEFFSCEAPSVG